VSKHHYDKNANKALAKHLELKLEIPPWSVTLVHLWNTVG